MVANYFVITKYNICTNVSSCKCSGTNMDKDGQIFSIFSNGKIFSRKCGICCMNYCTISETCEIEMCVQCKIIKHVLLYLTQINLVVLIPSSMLCACNIVQCSGVQPHMIKETSVNIDSARETQALHSVNKPITYLVWKNC